METLKRINLDKVQEAFEVTGIEPRIALMSSCVMGAVCYPYTHMEDFMKQGFDKYYVYGIMDGWDYGDASLSTWQFVIDTNNIKYKIGKADGAAARKIMNPS